jgi:arylsulfatase A-like enzyme
VPATRPLIRCLCLALVVLSFVTVDPAARRAAAREPYRPNVLIIVTDDQRDGLGVMPKVRRWFGRGGRKFPHAFVTTPQCCPSRASILTGRYSHNHGVINNKSGREIDPRMMLQYFLQQRGYRTALFGKYLNTTGGRTSPPYFNKWAKFVRGGSYVDATYDLNGDIQQIEGYTTTVLGDLAVDFLAQSDENYDSRPWMLLYTPTAPHEPAVPEPKYEDAAVPEWDQSPSVHEESTLGGLSDKPPFIQSEPYPPQPELREQQLRTLMSVDDVVGRLFRTLKELRENNTIAVFMSDNGFLWGEHGWAHKAVAYTESIEVPFFVRWPRRIDPGSRDERIVANIDVTPTILKATRAAPENALFDGRSLLDPSWQRERLLFEFYGPEKAKEVPPWASLRTSEYQYVEYYDAEGNVTFSEYYDLVQDPWQLHNLLGDDDPTNDPLTIALLHEQLKSDRSCSGTDCP